MNIPPNRITIIRDSASRGFTLVGENWRGELQVCEDLAFDEMLGMLARVFVPTISGEPNRKLGRPLFLTAPKS